MDDLEQRLQGALAETGGKLRESDLRWVVERGSKLRRMRLAATALSIAAAVAVSAFGVSALSGNEPLDRTPVVAGPTPSDGLVYEEMSEARRAEIFAFRAMARTGLMDPYGDPSYNFTYAPDTEEIGEGRWSVGFVKSDCAPSGDPKDPLFTCTTESVSNDESDPLGDVAVVVQLGDGAWVVDDATGNIVEGDRARLLGFSLPAEQEPSHWDFSAIGIFDLNGRALIEGFPVWVGPIPTDAPPSTCEFVVTDEDGKVTFEDTFLEQPPSAEELDGGIRGLENLAASETAEASVQCEQWVGPQEQGSKGGAS